MLRSWTCVYMITFVLFFPVNFWLLALPHLAQSTPTFSMSTVPVNSVEFNEQCFPIPEVTDTNYFLNSFNQLCSSTLDVIAPVKPRSNLKIRKQPWLNESCRGCKRNCRIAEPQWKKSGLQVHFLAMKEHLLSYNGVVKNTRTCYFSNLISANKHNPRFLFKTVDQLVNPFCCPC